MRTQLNLSLALALLAGINHAVAQQPVISSFSQNGVLVCTNLQPGTVASVEWASSLTGPWQTNWSGLDAATADTDGNIPVDVPLYYRVRGVAYTWAPDGMVLIPGGSFTMGNSIGDADIHDAAPVTANVSAFYMDTNLVSWSQWQGVYGYATNRGYGLSAGAGKAANHPVLNVDWYDCVKWCNARSEQAGKVPVYYTDAGLTQVYTNGGYQVTVYVDWGAKGYRLPTEAEWERAARGGLSAQRFPWGNTISWSQANYNVLRSGLTNNYAYDVNATRAYNPAWTNGGSPYTTPVGSFPANGYALEDMAGNVGQWCWDWYGTPYAGGTDPRGVATGSLRVCRGGRWADYADYCRTAYRGHYYPTVVAIGFRSVLPPGQ